MELEPVFADIAQAKAQLGSDLVVLVHHYQRDDVIRFADYRGDSLQLSRVAAEQRQASYIVFCGVNFMAETAVENWAHCCGVQLWIMPTMYAP